MTSKDKTEDEILGLDSPENTLDLTPEANDLNEDIEGTDEMLLLSSPSPSPPPPLASSSALSNSNVTMPDDETTLKESTAIFDVDLASKDSTFSKESSRPDGSSSSSCPQPPFAKSKSDSDKNSKPKLNPKISTSSNDNKVHEIIDDDDDGSELSSKPKSKRDINTSELVDQDQVHEIIDDDEDDDLEIIDDDLKKKTMLTSKADTVEEEIEDVEDSSEEDLDDEFSEEEEEIEEDESDESTSFTEGKINIFFSHGAFLIWNAEDVNMLREECRIVGKLTGCLPRAPRQNTQLGLPLQLMPEEAKLLVDIHAASLVQEESVPKKTMKLRESAFKKVRKQNFKIQQRLYKEDRKEEVKRRMSDIIAGKKAKKRQLQQEKEARKKQTLELSDSQPNTSQPQSAKKRKKALKKDLKSGNISVMGEDRKEEDDDDEEALQLTVDDLVTEETSEKHTLVQIFTENPWKRSFSSLRDEWTFPGTEKELLRYLVFKDLWGKGFYLTSGSKFGGDFLVYPGDPARFHSHYIAICRSQYEELPCLDIVSLGRLASNVRKTALLCALDKNQKVIYTSLQWTGFS